jgi:hypothetical protein
MCHIGAANVDASCPVSAVASKRLVRFTFHLQYKVTISHGSRTLMKQVETLRSRNLATHSNMQGIAGGCIGVLIREILDGGEQSA